MRVYVLEDDPERIVSLVRFFDQRPKVKEVQWSQTCGRADEFKPPYDLILLDHDLGGRQMTTHQDNGREFLHLIKDQIGNALVIVHSYDAGAAALMKTDWPSAVIAPFNTVRFCSLLEAVTR